MTRLASRHILSRLVVSTLLMGLWSAQLPAPAQYSPAPGTSQTEESPDQYYADYSEQAMTYFRNAEYTKAIDLLTKAYQLSPQNTAVLNNLAASYIQRGVYFQNNRKDFEKAISDYRMGLFYLVHEWPEGIARSGGTEENVKILHYNIEGSMKNLNIPVNDAKWHLQAAWDLRRKGKLQEALVEYAWVTQLNPRHAEAWAALGDLYTVRQKHDKAVNAYQKAVDTSSAPSDALYVKLGTALLQNKTPDKSVEAYNKALSINPKNRDALLALEQVWNKEIKLNPRNMSAHLNLGAVYQQMGRFDDAYAHYQVADRLSPNNTLVKLNLGSLYQAKGQLDQAGAMYDAVLQTSPNNARALLYKADILKQQGKTLEAEQFLQKALQTSTDKQQILDQLIAVYKTQGDPEKLKAGWQRYTQAFPNDPTVHYQAGLSLHEIKDYDSAVAYYQQAVKLNPDMAEAYANLGSALHALNRQNEAQQALKKALALDPNLQEVKDLLVAIEQQRSLNTLLEAAQLHEQGKYDDAIRGYEAALKQDPDNADIHARLGLARQALKRYTEAIQAYDKAISLDPENATYYFYKGTAYDEQDQFEAAQKLYEKALSLNPDLTQARQALESLQNAGVQTFLVQALEAYNQKSYTKALQLTDKVLKTDPQNALAYYYRGLVFDAQHKLDIALDAYQKAVNLDPGLSDAVYAMALVLDTQGKKPDAKKAYQQFIELTKNQPEDDYIRYAKERVSSL